jgi:hypothetical protein
MRGRMRGGERENEIERGECVRERACERERCGLLSLIQVQYI